MSAPKRWNAYPAAFNQTIGPVYSPQKAIRSIGLYLIGAFVSFILPGISSYVFQLQSLQGYKPILDTTCIAAALGFLLQIINTCAKWSSSQKRVKAQEKLSSTQRSLLGIPPAPVKSPAPVARNRLNSAAAPQPTTPAPITPPLQRQRPPSTPASPWSDSWVQHTPASGPAALGAPGPLATPASATPTSLQRRTPPSTRTRSPGTKDICTPEQLTHYLDAFSKEAQAPTTQEPLYSTYSTTPYNPYSSPGDASTPAPLPLGRDAPKYHMSWVRKGTTSTSVSDVLQPSSAEEVDEVMEKVLRMSRDELDVWTERLREWLSEKVLRPLVKHIEGVHEEVNAILLQLGEQHTRLPPLQAVVTPTAGDKLQVDVESTIGLLEYRCEQAAAQRPAEVQNLRQGLQRYRHLVRLLRGEQPSQLLQPPAPTGYLISRIQALAVGTCLAEFEWNGGGLWNNRPWTIELPTDGAIVLYLFSAFLEAPGWEWRTDANGGLPLFVGQLPSRPPRQYSLIMAKRPDKLSKEVAALVVLNLASVEPLHSLYFEGRILSLSPSYLSLFHAMLMFTQYHKMHRNGMLGRYPMDNVVVDLAKVVDPVRPASLVSIPQRVLGWWFPAPDS